MDEGELDAIREMLSDPRLETYLRASGRDLRTALRLYAWNKEVSGAFYGLIGCFEVALRNALHGRLTERFGQTNWWNAPELELHSGSMKEVVSARRTLEKRRRKAEPDAMVAELTFGFWVSLLGSGNNYETRLWRPALRKAFHGYSGSRKELHREIQHVNWLRNRVAHYEPIFGRHLEADHASIVRLISYIAPRGTSWVRKHDRVPEVLACRMIARDGERRPRF